MVENLKLELSPKLEQNCNMELSVEEDEFRIYLYNNHALK